MQMKWRNGIVGEILMLRFTELGFFEYSFHYKYDICSNADINCAYWEHYNEGQHATRIQKNRHLVVDLNKMHDLQNLTVNIF